MILTTGSTYGLTVDTRWTCGIFTYRDDDGATIQFELPFLGWITEVSWTRPRDDPDRSDSTTGPRRPRRPARRADLIACSQGIRGDSRADRIHRLGRVTYLAGRLVWLESTSLHREELEAKYPMTAEQTRTVAEEIAHRERTEWEADAVASGKWVLLEGDGVIEADRYDPAVHGPRKK